MMPNVAVIGGGISGLTAAYRLMRQGYRVAVLESEPTIGGKARSEDIHGFLMEHGPSALVAEPGGLQLASEIGIDRERVELGDGVRKRYVVAHDKLHGVAIHPAGFLTGGLLSAAGRLRLLAEALVPRGGDDEETVAEFCHRRFGREFTDRVIDPLVCGMFAGVADRLSMAATFPKLVAMERKHGSVIRAVLHNRLRGGRMPARRMFSWRRGVASLPEALAQRLGASIRTGVVAQRVEARRRGYVVATAGAGNIACNAIVIATPPRVTADLLRGLDDDAAEAAASIDTPPLSVAFLGYERRQIEHPLDGMGFLTPNDGRRRINGALFCSTMFQARAPDGFVSLAAYFGGDRAPSVARLPVGDLIALARREFAELLGARGDPVLARVRQWRGGLPQYRVGHRGLVAAIEGLGLRRPGLFVTGNYLTGVSVGACVTHASRAALQAAAYLGARMSDDRPLTEGRIGARSDEDTPSWPFQAEAYKPAEGPSQFLRAP